MAATIDPRLVKDMQNAGKVEITCTVQIGNSDDKLTQREWVSFIRDVHIILRHTLQGMGQMHFFGTAPPDGEYQNAAWVFVLDRQEAMGHIRDALAFTAERYGQDSIALTVGQTDLVLSPAGKAKLEEGQPRKEIRT